DRGFSSAPLGPVHHGQPRHSLELTGVVSDEGNLQTSGMCRDLRIERPDGCAVQLEGRTDLTEVPGCRSIERRYIDELKQFIQDLTVTIEVPALADPVLQLGQGDARDTYVSRC